MGGGQGAGDVGHEGAGIMEIDELFPFRAFAEDTDLPLIPLGNHGTEFVEAADFEIARLDGEVVAQEVFGDAVNDFVVPSGEDVGDG